MNAGAHGGQMADVLVDVEVFRLEEGRVDRVPAAQARFSYRHSELPSDAVVTGAEFRLRSGDPVTIRTAMDEARAWRRRTQPLAEPNCGSVFKNPVDGHAAPLIEQAGMKGTRIGRAGLDQARELHRGRRGSPRRGRARLDRPRPADGGVRTGVVLEPEVRLIGGSIVSADEHRAADLSDRAAPEPPPRSIPRRCSALTRTVGADSARGRSAGGERRPRDGNRRPQLHPIFGARVVRVEGEERLAPRQVMRLAGIERGTNVVHLDTSVAESRLEAEPWVLDATVARSFPSTITISVRERIPCSSSPPARRGNWWPPTVPRSGARRARRSPR